MAVTVNAVIGQLLLKFAIGALGITSIAANFPRFIVLAARSPWIYLSVLVQVFGYVLWMVLISRVKLGVATASVGAGFYILMALSAWGVYGESLTVYQWLGIALITVGLTFVSLGPV